MTDEEARMLREIHDALFGVPAGSGADAKPLIEALRIMWTSYQRGSWAGRTLVWVILTLGSLAAAGTTIMAFFGKTDG